MITLKFFVRCMENLEKMTVKYIENNDRKINYLLHTYYFSDINIFMYFSTALLITSSCFSSIITSICCFVRILLLLFMYSTYLVYFCSLFLPWKMIMCFKISSLFRFYWLFLMLCSVLFNYSSSWDMLFTNS
jgi:hypothetical protein